MRVSDTLVLKLDSSAEFYKNIFFYINFMSEKLFFPFMLYRYVSPSDAGAYECQISTEPKMSRMVGLKIKGERECLTSQRELISGATQRNYASLEVRQALCGFSMVGVVTFSYEKEEKQMVFRLNKPVLRIFLR
jgi:hypothetical protein